MNPFQKLLRLLEERGVEITDCFEHGVDPNEPIWLGWEHDGRIYKVYQYNVDEGTLVVGGLTPEQALDATVGRFRATTPDADSDEDISKLLDLVFTPDKEDE